MSGMHRIDGPGVHGWSERKAGKDASLRDCSAVSAISSVDGIELKTFISRVDF